MEVKVEITDKRIADGLESNAADMLHVLTALSGLLSDDDEREAWLSELEGFATDAVQAHGLRALDPAFRMASGIHRALNAVYADVLDHLPPPVALEGEVA